ncbi:MULTISPECIES: YesL family protein [Bacillus]|uniref:YesL family protein n=1 Tax=Bacillus TaxID=1386 RepID=UPI000BB8C65A|nr:MULTISPECIES: DUF624 domain-containing protein [Bacillus]
MGKVMQIAEFVYKFIALNVLWVLFVLAGLGLFGFMPATLALFQVIREWIKGDKEISLFSKFYTFYKQSFVKSNIIGAIFLGIFYIIYVNYSFVSHFYDESIRIFVYILIFGIAAIAIMTFLNVFSVMAHFEYKTLQYIKVAAGLVFARPFITVIQLVWLLAYFLIAINYPKPFLVIGVSVFAYVLMSINYMTFKKYNAA